jgi:hypothetical protein
MENRSEQQELQDVSFGQRLGVFTGSAVVTCGLPTLFHAPLPLAVAGGVAAFCIAKKSPEIMSAFQAHFSFLPVQEMKREQSPGDWSFTDRLLGRHYPEREGSNERLQAVSPDLPDPERVSFNQDTGATLPDFTVYQGPFSFSSVLSTGFEPTIERLYLARDASGLPLTCHARDLCHVATTGPTGEGKSSIERLLMAQLCHAKIAPLLLNPHYTGYDIEAIDPWGRHGEDWTPFEPYLLRDPMQCRDYRVIARYLEWAAKTEIPARLERRAHRQPVGQPLFLVVDELPSILREIPDVASFMLTILEEGRKVGVFLISAAHNFLVKTVAPKLGGGSIRDCYRTVYYGGGDNTTAQALLGMSKNEIEEKEGTLGKGVVMLRSAAAKKPGIGYVPFVDNEALYRLLGPSTYQPKTVLSVPVDLSILPDVKAELTPEQQINALIGQFERRAITQAELLAGLERIQTRQTDLAGKDAPHPGTNDRRDPIPFPIKPSAQHFTPGLTPALQQVYDLCDGRRSHREIAKLAGMSHPTVGKYISILQAKGLVDARGRKVESGKAVKR